MMEITRERAQQIFAMMLFLKNSGKYTIVRMEARLMPSFENYQLKQIDNTRVAELDFRGGKYYYSEF